MTITHLKLWLTQDCDIEVVKAIVGLYDNAKLDEDNYIVYYNAEPEKVLSLSTRLIPFKYGVETHNEEF